MPIHSITFRIEVDDMRLQNRVALITGANRGIGEAIANRLAEEGAVVAINFPFESLREQALLVKKNIIEKGGVAEVFQADVTKKDEIDEMVTKIEAKLGDVEILVNNAGIAPFESLFNVTEEIWDRTYATNVKAIFLLTQRVGKKMVDKKYGKIINITSTAGTVVTSPVIPHYISSKGAAAQLTKALAIELGRHNINVNGVGPSTVETDFVADYLKDPKIYRSEIEANPMKRLGTAKQIGDAVVFLASEEAMQINGHILMVDGGLSVKAAQPEDHMER